MDVLSAYYQVYRERALTVFPSKNGFQVLIAGFLDPNIYVDIDTAFSMAEDSIEDFPEEYLKIRTE